MVTASQIYSSLSLYKRVELKVQEIIFKIFSFLSGLFFFFLGMRIKRTVKRNGESSGKRENSITLSTKLTS